MTEIQNPKQYDLEERTFLFARKVREFVRKLPKTISNIEDCSQLIRASGSQAANYIEANEALSKKDFLLRVRISKKETKESRLWLRLTEPKPEEENEQARLIAEANELMRIFGSILEKAKA